MIFAILILSLCGSVLVGAFYDHIQQHLQLNKFYQQFILFILLLSMIVFVQALVISSIAQIKALTTQVNTLTQQVELLEQRTIMEAKP
jgi:predicted PurR-regulated permease PerM